MGCFPVPQGHQYWDTKESWGIGDYHILLFRVIFIHNNKATPVIYLFTCLRSWNGNCTRMSGIVFYCHFHIHTL
nr:unnamed protein product [Callosobruchus analis]